MSGTTSAPDKLQHAVELQASGKRERVRCVRPGPGSPPAVARCTPQGDGCGWLVADGFASDAEVSALRAIADRGMDLGGGSGGPTILDLQSGALSLEDKFIDVWYALNVTGRRPFTRSELRPYAAVVERAAALLRREFGSEGLQLTAPTFFSRIRADRPPVIPNDEYWHSHVDTLQYGSFVLTSLLYLSDADADFRGGDLVFEAQDGRSPARVAPRRGRLVAFSSGAELPHHVARVTDGVRLALTVAFTCSPEAAIRGFLSRAATDDQLDRDGG